MRMHRTALVMTATLCVAGLLSLAVEGPAAAVSVSKIAFTSSYSSGQQVFLMNQDGSGLQPTGLAAYSVDLRGDLGRLVVGGTDGALYSTKPDGTDVVPLGIYGHAPKWSPDGTHLLVVGWPGRLSFRTTRGRSSAPPGYLTVVNSDGSNPYSLGVEAADADWSPTGTEIVFCAPENDSSPGGALWTMNADGTGITDLGLTGWSPRWSPDGTRIAFLFDSAGTSQIGIAHLTRARAVSSVTTIPVRGDNLVWSPDGNQLLVAVSGAPVAVVNADGTGTPESLGVEAQWVSWKATGGANQADLRIAKTVDPRTVPVGGKVRFTVTVTNDGPDTATNVKVFDALPASLSGVQISSTGVPSSYASDRHEWSIPSLPPQSSATLTVDATVSATGTLTNTAEVTASSLPDPDSTPNNHVATEDDQDSATVKVVEADAPDLAGCRFYNNRFLVEFSEDVVQTQAEEPANYLLQVASPDDTSFPPPAGLPPQAVLHYTPAAPAQSGQPAAPARLVVTGVAFRTRSRVRLQATGIEDLAGNVIDDGINVCQGLVVLPPGTRLSKVAGDQQTGPVGTTLPAELVVELRDAQSLPVPSAAVHFTPDFDAGMALQVLPGRQVGDGAELVVETGKSGRAQAKWRLGAKAGQQRLKVTVDPTATGSPQEFTATATPGTPREVLLSGVPLRAQVGSTVKLAATVLDAKGNGVPDVPVTVRTTAGGGTVSILSSAGKTDRRGELKATLDGVTLGSNIVEATVASLHPAEATITGVWRLPLGPGLHLFTLPFRLVDANPAHVLGLPSSQFRLATYLTREARFVFYPQIDLPLEFARGYFGLFATGRTIDLTEGTPGISQMPFALVYPSKGWHLIGNPFLTSLYWRVKEIHVLARDEDLGPLSHWLTGPAAIHRPVEPYLFVVDPDARPGDPYRLVFDPAVMNVIPAALRPRVVDHLSPGQGAWALTKVADAGFRFPLSVTQPTPPRGAGASRRSSRQTVEGWSLELIATDGELSDGGNVIGVSSSSALQLPEPPSPPQTGGAYLSLSLLPEGRSRQESAGGLLCTDVRPEGGATPRVWQAIVRTNRQGAPIMIRWPNLGTVPPHVRLYLTDSTTGTRRAMRTTTSYTFTSSRQATTERRFRITAETGATSHLTIGSLRVVPSNRGGGWSLSYTLNQPATVDVVVRSAAGRTVRRLGPQVGRAGVNLCEWANRSATGQTLPRGVYLVEVLARSDTGEQTRRVGLVSVR